MTRSPALRNDLGHLIDLSLRASESPEPLLRQLSRPLVLAVAQEFDDAALVGCEAVTQKPVSPQNSSTDHNADVLLVYGVTYPETSRTISRTNAVLLLRWPFMR